jgi:hypothetical protein
MCPAGPTRMTVMGTPPGCGPRAASTLAQPSRAASGTQVSRMRLGDAMCQAKLARKPRGDKWEVYPACGQSSLESTGHHIRGFRVRLSLSNIFHSYVS